MLAVFFPASGWQVVGQDVMERRPWSTERAERYLADLTCMGDSCLCNGHEP